MVGVCGGMWRTGGWRFEECGEDVESDGGWASYVEKRWREVVGGHSYVKDGSGEVEDRWEEVEGVWSEVENG